MTRTVHLFQKQSKFYTGSLKKDQKHYQVFEGREAFVSIGDRAVVTVAKSARPSVYWRKSLNLEDFYLIPNVAAMLSVLWQHVFSIYQWIR